MASGASSETLICSEQSSAFDKPIVVIEGYDFGEYLDSPINHESLVKSLSSGDLLNNLKALGYDVFVVDLPQHVDSDLNTTGELVRQTLKQIWAKTTKTTPITLVGLSTGGVWGTIASLTEESGNDTDKFQVAKVITLDSPHNGAILPQSLVDLAKRVDDLRNKQPLTDYDITTKAKNSIRDAVKDGFLEVRHILNSQSARELLVYNSFGSTNEHIDFYNSYHELIKNNLNTSIYFAGMVNGSWTGQTQGLPDNGLIMDFNGYKKKSVLISGIEGGLTFKLYSPAYSPNNETIMDVKLHHRYTSALDHDDINYWAQKTTTNALGFNYENGAGGKIDLYGHLLKVLEAGEEVLRTFIEDDGYTEYQKWVIDYDLFDTIVKNFPVENNSGTSFISTFSSAGLGIISDDISFHPNTNYSDLENQLRDMEYYSFLDDINHQNENLTHPQPVTTEQQQWLFDKITKPQTKLRLNIVPTIITPLLLN